jgi:hypothetical protein
VRRLLPAIVAAAAYVVMAMHGAAHSSGTYDEFVHVTAGYSYSAYNDYRLDPENGNWPQRLIALPLFLGGTEFPSLDQPAWRASDMWTLSDELFFGPGRDTAGMLRSSRMVVAVFGALLAMLVFLWSRSLYGTAGGWVSLLVFAFSPTMLAHGGLATSDLIGAAFFTAAVWALWTVLHRVNARSVGVSVLATGAAFLSKLSAPALIPISLLLVMVRSIAGKPLSVRWRTRTTMLHSRRRQGAAIAGLVVVHIVFVWLLIWASYGFRYSAFGAGLAGQHDFIDSWSDVLSDRTATTGLLEWSRDHRILPEAYLYGIASVDAYAQHRSAFLNGRVVTGRVSGFFPYLTLAKTTIPALILLGLVPVTLLWRRRHADSDDPEPPSGGFSLYALTPLLVLIGVYWVFALSSSLNIGHRHLMPMMPAAIVLLGASGYAIERAFARRSVGTVVPAMLVIGLVLWHVGESVRIAPHYLAYFNELDGGPDSAYQHVVDSSLDWGQDLPTLQTWLAEQGLSGEKHDPVYLSYFGTARPEAYGVRATPLPSFPDHWSPHEPEPLQPGVYCISATMLQGVYLTPQAPWTAHNESDYQALLYNLRLFDSTAAEPRTRAALLRQTGPDFWLKVFHAFEQHRLARLTSYLRRRAPDAEVGHSILVYRVDAAELGRALQPN